MRACNRTETEEEENTSNYEIQNCHITLFLSRISIKNSSAVQHRTEELGTHTDCREEVETMELFAQLHRSANIKRRKT